MQRINALDLARKMPHEELPQVIDPDRGVQHPPAARSDFIAPEILIDDDPQTAPATLIVAPAATGKSTCAAEIARQANALLIDLKSQLVADGTFNGLLDESLGDDAALDYRKSLRAGQSSLIIDSLDETHLKSRETNFVAFIRGVCRFLRTSVGDGNLLLFSRLDTAEWIKTTFQEENVGLRECSLDFFGEREAHAFIDVKLDRLYGTKGRPLVHRQHRSQFLSVKGRLLERIGQGIGLATNEVWNSNHGRRFLGYSPVLEAVANYLCVPDFRKVDPSRLGTAGSGEESPEWVILSNLANSLLVREQQKFAEGWLDELIRPMFAEAELKLLYSPEEQCQRLLASVRDKPRPTELSAWISKDLRPSYDEAVDVQLLNHPFLESMRAFVSGVFEDYVSASVITGESDSAASRKAEIAILRSASHLPSPLLAPFVMTLASDSGVHSLRTDICDLVMESLTAAEDQALSYSFDLTVKGQEGGFTVARICHETVDRSITSTTTVPLRGSLAGLVLPARMQNVVIVSDGGVDVSGGETAHFGPEVDVRAAEFVCDAAQLLVSGSVTVRASLVISPYDQEVKVFDGQLAVLAEDVEGSLSSWRVSLPDGLDPQLETDFYAFRRLLRFFRKTQHAPKGQVAADKEQLKKYVLRTDQHAREILTGLESDSYVTSDGVAYYLDLGLLREVGLAFGDVELYKTSPELLARLTRWTKTR